MACTLHVAWDDRLVHSGELEAIRVGRSVRVPEQAVNQYLSDAFVEKAG